MPIYPLWPVAYRPKSAEEMRTRIAAEFGVRSTNQDVEVYDREHNRVRIKLGWLFQHFWHDHPERWNLVPIVRPAIKQAHHLTRVAPGERSAFYPALLTTRDDRSPRPLIETKDYLTYVAQEGGKRYGWKSMYAVRPETLRYRERNGRRIWPATTTTKRRNPTPARPHGDAVRSGRPSRASRKSTSPVKGLLFLVGVMVVAAYVAERQQGPGGAPA